MIITMLELKQLPNDLLNLIWDEIHSYVRSMVGWYLGWVNAWEKTFIATVDSLTDFIQDMLMKASSDNITIYVDWELEIKAIKTSIWTFVY